jgi:hypothetical protein
MLAPLFSLSAILIYANLPTNFGVLSPHTLKYEPINVFEFGLSHDRFMIIDEDVYHIGASLKDLGKKWFAFSKMSDIKADHLIKRIQ